MPARPCLVSTVLPTTYMSDVYRRSDRSQVSNFADLLVDREHPHSAVSGLQMRLIATQVRASESAHRFCVVLMRLFSSGDRFSDHTAHQR